MSTPTDTRIDTREGRSSLDDRPFVVPLLAALLLALAAFASGCGNDDGSAATPAPSAERSAGSTPEVPAGTSRAAEHSGFCAVYLAPPPETASDDVEVAVAAEHRWAADLEQAGPPEGAGQQARHGYRAFVQALAELTAEDLRGRADLDEQFGADADDVRVFIGYAATICGGG